MYFLAHRGNTIKPEPEKENALGALLGALEKGHGIETDIRDLNGELVISHDIPRGSPLKFGELLDALPPLKAGQLLALNVKSDGQHKLLKEVLESRPELGPNCFFFDMSVPTLYLFSKFLPKENLATRVSDIEPEPDLYDSASWLWVDCFTKDYSDFGALRRYLDDGKKLALVSPDLHKRDPYAFWEALKDAGMHKDEVWLCTDYIERAKEFFEG